MTMTIEEVAFKNDNWPASRLILQDEEDKTKLALAGPLAVASKDKIGERG